MLNNDLASNTGSGRFCLSLVKALRDASPAVSVTILTADRDLGRSWWHFLGFGFLRLRTEVRRCDIIHALDGWPYGLMAMLTSKGLNKKVVITAVGTGAVQPLYRPIKRMLLGWAYRRADRLVAVSNNTRREILKVVPDLDIRVINHGVDFSKFPACADASAGRQVPSSKFQEVENLKPYILSVGALKKRKGYDCSIRAFAQVSKRIPDLKYVIVGEGAELKNIQFLISNFQLQGKVVVFPKVEDDFLVGLYRNAELFILLPQDDNKDIEGFGLVFLEAAAAGLPVVAASGTSAEDAVLGGRSGFLVDAQDIDQAAGVVERVLSGQELRRSLSAGAMALAKSMSWGRAASEYLRVYKSIAPLRDFLTEASRMPKD